MTVTGAVSTVIEYTCDDEVTFASSLTMKMHQDETLSVLSMYDGLRDTSNPTTKSTFQIDFDDKSMTDALAFPTQHQTLEELVATTLVCINQNKEFYQSVPKERFHPHVPLTVSSRSDMGSIDLTIEALAANDEATEMRRVGIPLGR